MADLIGQSLGKYQIERQLGRGGMATVYLAHDTQIERPVAIKVLPREFAHDPTFLERFKREAKSIASLNHPGILPIHDYGEDEGWTYIVMAYMEQGSLSDLIRASNGGISVEDASSACDQIASALEYAHGRGIIHRDIKPANVLVGEQGNLVLADFGIAKVSEATAQLTGSGLIGSPAYMAPEMANAGGITTLVDIYAMGVMLYEMVTGRLPYDAETPMGLLMAHGSIPVPDVRAVRPDLSDDVQYVIDRSMAKNPTVRYQSAREMAEDMQAATGEGVVTRVSLPDFEESTLPLTLPGVTERVLRQPETQPAQQTGRKSRLLVIIGAVIGAAGLTLAALFGLGVLGGGEEQAEPVGEEPTEVPTAAQEPTVFSGDAQEEATLIPEPVTLMPVVHTKGVVEFTRPEGDMFALLEGGLQEIEVGSAVRTIEADSAALMIFGEGVAAEVQPLSQIEVDLLAFDNDTLLVELTQTSGISYHFVTADVGGEVGRDYTVTTPVAEVRAAGTQFWVIELEDDLGWMFIPTQGSILLEVGERDDDVGDNFLAHAANGDCVIIDFEGNVSDCDASSITDTPLSDSSGFVRDVAPTAGATPTSEVVAPVSTAVSTETVGTAVWGACGSCNTCGFAVDQCVLSPEGACLWDPSGCSGGSSCLPNGSPCSAGSNCCNGSCAGAVCP